jgi:hypothetical protein
MHVCLTINGSAFDARAAGVAPATLVVSADEPRALTLLQRNSNGALCCAVPAAAIPLWATVEMSIDGVVRFAGRVLRRTYRRGDAGAGEIVYACGDGRMLARLVSVVDDFGEPRLSYNTSSRRAAGDAGPDGVPVSAILADVLERHRAELAALGAAPAVGSPYRAAELAALPPLPVEISATNADLDGVVAQAIDAVPGGFAWFDPASRQWRFGRAAATAVVEALLDGAPENAPESFEITEAAFPCWTAIEAFGDAEKGKKSRGLQMVRLSTGGLVADWDAALEPTWTREKAAISDPARRNPALDDLPPALQAALNEELRLNLADNPFTWVFRRFRIANFSGAAGMTRPQLWQRINPPTEPNPRWQPVRTHFDRRTGRAIAAVPMLSRGNPRVPGAAKIAYDAALTFKRRIPGDAEPATAIRVPAQGHAGPAAAIGVRATRKVHHSRLSGETAATVASLIAAEQERLSRLITEGELTLPAGSIDLFEPGRRLRLRQAGGVVAPAIDPAFVRSATLEFGPPARWRVTLG